MPICVECGKPVPSLYTEYSKQNIQLYVCNYCNNFADQYIEHDYVIIFMDLLLHKKQVYRHILFNQLDYVDSGVQPAVKKLAILLILFDVYIKWLKLENIPKIHVLMHYFYILLICTIELCIFHASVRFMIWLIYSRKYEIIKYNYVTIALIISSFSKLLLILMVIWSYDGINYSWYIDIIVFTSNVEALSVFLDESYIKTIPILLFGVLMRTFFSYTIHKFDYNNIYGIMN
ncbi:hypothetical protein BCR32DRAFT_266192 [Anaeromyces robustus]|uniref:Protein ARV n=1 Tax=Anaeromyces robustus TaxID=1754192 RepID=A0A1Y1XFY9_9FUNG|nr:hypothetical protein BCR32DRAFT_266192 [Anaeromyces robustus]|eukprot:ORX84679.1 hypothetical protein BCR32DRAFT_266192 [Anaeromyces robustus]